MTRFDSALQWLASQFSATRDDFRRAHKTGSDMLLDGMVAQGFAWFKDGRYAVSAAGRKRMAAMEPVSE